MACRLFGANPLSEPTMTYCQLDHKKHILMKCYLKFKSFIQGEAFENIAYEIAAILSQPQCVNALVIYHILALHHW